MGRSALTRLIRSAASLVAILNYSTTTESVTKLPAYQRRARGGKMASTNEDAMVLATSRLDDGRLLVMRHLPDRATVEIGFWRRDASGVT